jgi:hypothetical protein
MATAIADTCGQYCGAVYSRAPHRYAMVRQHEKKIGEADTGYERERAREGYLTSGLCRGQRVTPSLASKESAKLEKAIAYKIKYRHDKLGSRHAKSRSLGNKLDSQMSELLARSASISRPWNW